MTHISGKVAIPSNVNKYHFKIDLVLISGANSILKIVIVVVTIVIYIAIALMYSCKAGGNCPCAINCVRRMTINKDGEEVQSYSLWHIIMTVLYIVGSVGAGFYLSTVFYEIIALIDRGKLIKYQSYAPSLGVSIMMFVTYTVFFVFKLIDKSTPLIAVYYENGQVSWGQQFVINKI